MGAETWLLIGLVSAVALLVAGYAAGWYSQQGPIDVLEIKYDGVLEQVQELFAQGESGKAAAEALISVERRMVAASRAGTVRGRRRLLLGSSEHPPDLASGSAPEHLGGASADGDSVA